MKMQMCAAGASAPSEASRADSAESIGVNLYKCRIVQFVLFVMFSFSCMCVSRQDTVQAWAR